MCEAGFLVYTDGSCDTPKRIGGLATTIQDKETGIQIGFAMGFENVTNNIMEMLAIIIALERLSRLKQRATIIIRSDSQYAINCFSVWRQGWKNKGWTRGRKNGGDQEIKNIDLVKRYDRLIQNYPHEIVFQWVKGHAGEPGNELCDKLADQGTAGIHGYWGQEQIHGAHIKWKRIEEYL